MLDIAPARLQLVKTIPTGKGWLYEPKFDGYRGLIARHSEHRLSVLSRNGKDLGRFYPELIRLAESLPVGTAIDGEIVSPVHDGVSFTSLQHRLMVPLAERPRVATQSPVAFVAFDLLHERSNDVRRETATLRRGRLERVIGDVGRRDLQLIIQTSDPDAAAMWLDDSLKMAGIEGVVAKRDEAYPRANVRRWLKVRRIATTEVLVRGFIGEPESPRLVVALRDADEGRLAGATLPLGRDDAAVLKPLLSRALRADRPMWVPFDGDRRNDWYVLPDGLVAEVSFSHLDGDTFRQAVRFVRWRFEEPGVASNLRPAP